MAVGDILSMPNAFQRQGTPYLCGAMTNEATDITKLKQAINASADKVLYAGLPANVKNQYISSTNVRANYNPSNLTAILATTEALISGFCLMGQVDTSSGNSDPYSATGELTNVGLLGSGIVTYLPANTNISNIQTNATVYWNFTDGNLTTTAQATGATPLNLTVLSGLVDAYKLAPNTDGDLVWTACKAVRVKL